MDAFLSSTTVVALAEMGDKTQLLALVLSARYRAFLPVAAGILVATLANHLPTAAAGVVVADVLAGPWLRWAVAAAFLAVALWTLVPDKLDEDDMPSTKTRMGAFQATLIAFFLAELGDKTQIATAVLAAQHQELLIVTAGTTIGMLIANLPVVGLGPVFTRRLPLRLLRIVTAVIFAATGIFTLIGWPFS